MKESKPATVLIHLTEEDDLLSRSTKKCKRRSSGDFFCCHDMSQVIDIEPVEGITNAPQSQLAQLVGLHILKGYPFFKENPPIARMMKKKGGMEEAKSDGSICGLREERSMA